LPIFKNKGSVNQIRNCRSISNPCALSKLFEKLILKRILEILSTALQSITARPLDNGKYVLVSSLELSAAFDIVNVDLPIKRGQPHDVLDLINEWSTNRGYFVEITEKRFILFFSAIENCPQFYM
jgi:hypothetical protein